MNELTWLSISLFCSKSNAHHLLNKCVYPFITQCKSNYALKFWFFEFNTLLGENIRLPLLVQATDAVQISNMAKNHFTLFFTQLDFSSPPLHFPLNDIYLPFPENSIQFGLYSIFYHQKEINKFGLRQEISAILLEALREEEIDDETILTVSLYLHFALIKTVSDLFPNKASQLKSFYTDSESLPPDHLTLSFLHEKLDENRTVMKEIWDDVFYNTSFSRDYKWFNQWIQLCKEVSKGNFLENEVDLIYALNNQLGGELTIFQMIKYLVISTWRENTPFKK